MLKAQRKIDEPEKPMEKRITSASLMVAPLVKEYLGSSESNKVHDSICPFAKNINPANKVVFKTKAKAIYSGYQPCNCLVDVKVV